MSEELNLPAHIEAIPGGKWWKNNKTGKFIHADYIAKYCEAWWKYHPPGLRREIVSNKKNLKSAQKRWDDE